MIPGPAAVPVTLTKMTLMTLISNSLTSVRFDDNGGTLPEKVIQWAGLPSNNPLVREPFGTYKTPISVLNDDGFTFEQIANIIEEQL